MRRYFVLLAVVATSALAFSQNSLTDSANLRALLDEVRMLRHDLQTTTVAAQRVQIALYRLQLQDSAVERASNQAETARGRLADVVERRKHVAIQVEQVDEKRAHTEDAQERKGLEEALGEFKRNLDGLTAEEQQLQARAIEAENRLRAEQNKLDALHALLDQLDQALQNIGHESGQSK